MPKKIGKYIKKGIKTADSVAKVATKAYNIAKSVAELINVEFKYADTYFTLTPTTAVNAPGIHCVPVAQGNTANDRDGDQVRVKSWETRFNAVQNGASEVTTFRVLWIIDLLPETVAPTIADVLDTLNGASATVNSPRNLENKTRFIILKDKTYTLDSLSKRSVTNHWYRKLNIKPTWNDDGSEDYVAKHLFMLALSTEAANYPNIYVESRVRFLDN